VQVTLAVVQVSPPTQRAVLVPSFPQRGPAALKKGVYVSPPVLHFTLGVVQVSCGSQRAVLVPSLPQFGPVALKYGV
jgi:hypothetical protein